MEYRRNYETFHRSVIRVCAEFALNSRSFAPPLPSRITRRRRYTFDLLPMRSQMDKDQDDFLSYAEFKVIARQRALATMQARRLAPRSPRRPLRPPCAWGFSS